jgi:hypothetical protein
MNLIAFPAASPGIGAGACRDFQRWRPFCGPAASLDCDSASSACPEQAELRSRRRNVHRRQQKPPLATCSCPPTSRASRALEESPTRTSRAAQFRRARLLTEPRHTPLVSCGSSPVAPRLAAPRLAAPHARPDTLRGVAVRRRGPGCSCGPASPATPSTSCAACAASTASTTMASSCRRWASGLQAAPALAGERG